MEDEQPGELAGVRSGNFTDILYDLLQEKLTGIEVALIHIEENVAALAVK